MRWILVVGKRKGEIRRREGFVLISVGLEPTSVTEVYKWIRRQIWRGNREGLNAGVCLVRQSKVGRT